MKLVLRRLLGKSFRTDFLFGEYQCWRDPISCICIRPMRVDRVDDLIANKS